MGAGLFCAWLMLAEPAPSDLVAPVRTTPIEVVYPSDAAEQAEPPRGTVIVKLVVGTDGVPIELEVEQSVHPTLDAAAIEIVKSLRYTPATYRGETVEVTMRESIVFAPPLEGADGEPRVDRLRAVGRTDHSRFAAGARAHVAWPPRVDERHASAPAHELERAPPAERAGADDKDAGRGQGAHPTLDCDHRLPPRVSLPR